MPAEFADPLFDDRRSLLTLGVASLATGVLGCGKLLTDGSSADTNSAATNIQNKFEPKRSKKYLDDICKLGPRPSASKGMIAQQKLLVKHFEKLGAKVGYQNFDRAHPLTGNPVRMANLIVSWHPESKKRVLLACHYDTRPFPDQDKRNPRGRFIGANDGASGVALFMEMGHHMKVLKPTFGVDFVFFDAEEFVFTKKAELKGYFLGSKYFATQYVKKPPAHNYVWGVVADMVADRNLRLFVETNSLKYAPKLVDSIWRTAAKLRVKEFIPRPNYTIDDDHIPLNEIAKIPSCDIIDFDYPYWHTTQDVPSRCSGASLFKVGRVLLKWLENVPKSADD